MRPSGHPMTEKTAKQIVNEDPELALKVVKKVLLEKKIEELNNELWDLKKEIKESIVLKEVFED